MHIRTVQRRAGRRMKPAMHNVLMKHEFVSPASTKETFRVA